MHSAARKARSAPACASIKYASASLNMALAKAPAELKRDSLDIYNVCVYVGG
jgi:hypothetical protein